MNDRDRATAGPEWRVTGQEDDVRPRMFEQAALGNGFALATIVAADGGPRPIGAQMVITRQASWGFLSGGCIEDDVARNAQMVLSDGAPIKLIYGNGSPFLDIRLPCGGRLEVLIESVPPDDPALAALATLTRARRPALWSSDGNTRVCVPAGSQDVATAKAYRRIYTPAQGLLVVGTDPIALALAALGTSSGWETTLIAPFGPSAPAPFGVDCDRRALDQSLTADRLDPWTAVAVATHDLDLDEPALVAALQADCGYVGVLGSRRKMPERVERLRTAGLADARIARLHAPIGLDIGAQAPWEVAIAVMAQIIKQRTADAAGADHTAAPAYAGG